MVCTDPAMCECVWLMIAAVCVCRLGMCVGVGVRGGGLSGEVGYPGRWARGICFLL